MSRWKDHLKAIVTDTKIKLLNIVPDIVSGKNDDDEEE